MGDPGIADLVLRLVKLLPALAATNLPEKPERYIAELQISFVRVYKEVYSRQTQPGRSSDRVLTQYLDDQFRVFQNTLQQILVRPHTPTLKAATLNALMEGVRRTGVFDDDLFFSVLRTTITTQHGAGELIGMLLGKYLKYADIRYATLRGIPRLVDEVRASRPESNPEPDSAQQPGSQRVADESAEEAGGQEGSGSREDVARTLCDMLMQVPPEAPGEDDLEAWCGDGKADPDRPAKRRRIAAAEPASSAAASKAAAGSSAEAPDEQQERRVPWASTKSQRAAFGRAWLALLSMVPLPEDVYGRVLLRLHDRIIPHMTNPVFLADFLTHALAKGGLTGLLALNGIFVLVTAHGYEYPGLYAALYRLLTPAALASRHCPRYFKLADALLASTAVPAYTCAAFVKKLGRLALTAPPAGAVVALAFIHNLVRRQPACVKLLGAPPRPAAVAPEGDAADGAAQEVEQDWRDPFDADAEDPNDSNALDSVLWEATSLRQHYMPQVAASVALLDKDLADRRKGTEVPVDDLIASSYAKLVSAELERRLKTAPVAAKLRARLFEAAKDNSAFEGWDLT